MRSGFAPLSRPGMTERARDLLQQIRDRRFVAGDVVEMLGGAAIYRW